MKGSTIVRLIAVLFVLIVVFHHVFSLIYNPIKTETAVYYTATDGLDITGLIVRNETLVTADKNGVLHFLVSDGGRVPKDGLIANIYDNEASSITLNEIEDLSEKISDIEEILSYNDTDAINLDIINSKVQNDINDFILSTATSDFSRVNSSSSDLLSSINRKQAALGYDVDFASQLETLKAKYDSLSQKLPSAKGKIKAQKSGYFVSKTDGYEEILKDTNLDDLTYEFLEDINPKETPANAIGKIVSDYEWYIAAKVSVNESLNFKEGESLVIETSVKASKELPVTVKQINISEKSDNAVILFACNQMSSELATMRSGPMTVIKNRYSGLKIPKSALRVVDSVRGVYVESGMQVDFVPIEIVFKTDSYLICKKQSGNDNALKLYDKVVVKGKNLYDGKIIS